MDMLEGDDFNKLYEEMTDESNADWKTTKDMELHSKMSELQIENLETVDGSGTIAWNFQDLPDELILKVLNYSKLKDLISSGRVSKRLRTISHDKSLWQRVNISKKIVKKELLEFILNKECKSLILYDLTVLGSLSLHQKSQLKELEFYCVENNEVLEEILSSCYSLEQLDMLGIKITPKMTPGICQNAKTLQRLNLFCSFVDELRYLQIIKCCQKLKEVYLEEGPLVCSNATLEFLAKNISPHLEILGLDITDNHVKTLFSRCKKIKKLSLSVPLMTDDSLMNIRDNLNHTLEELTLYRTENISIFGLLKLKSMPRLKVLTLGGGCFLNDEPEEELEYLRMQLPNLTITALP